MEGHGTVPFALPFSVPVMTKERFAELAGLEVGVVRGMLDRGYLPGDEDRAASVRERGGLAGTLPGGGRGGVPGREG
ncbi:MAG TPA: hypothetical protein VKZ99_05170 [Gammaproteobacteria bacterium]|nr:hypothetical protein [Gammaproteobacteria bacterium]